MLRGGVVPGTRANVRALAPRIREAWGERAPEFGTYREFLCSVIPRPTKRPTRGERDARVALVSIARDVWSREVTRRRGAVACLR